MLSVCGTGDCDLFITIRARGGNRRGKEEGGGKGEEGTRCTVGSWTVSVQMIIITRGGRRMGGEGRGGTRCTVGSWTVSVQMIIITRGGRRMGGEGRGGTRCTVDH